MTELSTNIHCSHFPLCSGCAIQKNVIDPPIVQVLGKDVPIFYKEIIGWRTRAKLAVRGTAKSPEIGLFKRGTHDVVSIPDCPLHHPSINASLEILRKAIIATETDPYEEKTQRGVLRYVQCVVERKTSLVQLTLVVTKKGGANALVEYLKRWNGWHSIWLNFHPDPNNRVLGEEWERCYGDSFVWETLLEREFPFHPACFAQAHLSLFEEMLLAIKKSLLPQKKVVEFYAGIGVIGVSVSDLCQRVICSEINPYAKLCFDALKQKENVSFKLSSAVDGIPLLSGMDVVIVDPPRKGIDRELLEAIIRSSTLKQMIYVSCHVLSFKRDLEILLDAGWEVEQTEGYLLFPGSNHIEVLCVLKRNPESILET